MRKLKAFGYYGGKYSKLEWLLPQLVTPHKMYVELFAGSLVVLLNKPRVQYEVANDLAGEVADFWRAMRECPDELRRVIECSPPGEAEFKRVIDAPPTDDLVERARRFYVVISGSYGAHPVSRNHSFVGGMTSIAYRNSLQIVADRLRHVVVESTDAVRLINRVVNFKQRTESPSIVLMYADPPYTMDSRVGGGVYIHDEFDHVAFLDAVLAAPEFCKFAISGYDNELYNDRLVDWHRHEVVVKCMSTNSKRGSRYRTEILWRNYSLADADLFAA